MQDSSQVYSTMVSRPLFVKLEPRWSCSTTSTSPMARLRLDALADHQTLWERLMLGLM